MPEYLPAKNILRIINIVASIWCKNMLGYSSLNIYCSKLTVFVLKAQVKLICLCGDSFTNVGCTLVETLLSTVVLIEIFSPKGGNKIRTFCSVI